MFTFPISFFTNTTNGITINFDSLGGNDILYYLGTKENTTSWTNPNIFNAVTITASSVYSGTVSNLTDRSVSEFHTNNNTSTIWIKFNFGGNTVNPNYYVLRNRSAQASNYVRNWKLQGSNDDNTWTDLDTRTNNATLNTLNQLAGFTCTSSTNYKFLRILQTGSNSSGLNYLVLGEVYFYGQININSYNKAIPIKTNLILNLDSSSESTVFKDTNNLVYEWLDTSGLNNHVYQSNDNLKPTYTTSVQNSLSGIRWINNNTVLRPITNVAGRHCFIVIRHIESGSNFNGYRRLIDRGDNNSGGYAFFGDSGSTNYSPAVWDRNISSSNVWINGVNTVNATPVNNTKLIEFFTTDATTAGALAIGSHFSSDDMAQNMVGYILEVLLYADIKNSTEKNSITNYLNSKWAIY